MAETLRVPGGRAVAGKGNFSRNMRTINQQIRNSESAFRLAGAGVENYEKTIAGTEAKLSMLGQKLTQQQRAVEQYSRALVAANETLAENYDRHQDYTQRDSIVNWAAFAAAVGPVVLVLGKAVGAVSTVTEALGKAFTVIGKFSASVSLADGGIGGFVKVPASSKMAAGIQYFFAFLNIQTFFYDFAAISSPVCVSTVVSAR